MLDAISNTNIGGLYMRGNGFLFKYNSKTNEFLIAKPDGTIETPIRPKDEMNYWLEQLRVHP